MTKNHTGTKTVETSTRFIPLRLALLIKEVPIPYLNVVPLGGTVGLEALIVKPSLDISTNSAGVFLTKATALS